MRYDWIRFVCILITWHSNDVISVNAHAHHNLSNDVISSEGVVAGETFDCVLAAAVNKHLELILEMAETAF